MRFGRLWGGILLCLLANELPKRDEFPPPNEIFVISKRHPILPKIATVLPHWITIEILCNCINHYILLCSTDPDVIADLYELLSQVIRKCHTMWT